MSISAEIQRLQQAKSDLATSIANKGVTVPVATTIDGYAALVDQIQQGGTPVLPYDAEIEYLETTGTQYIDTGIELDNWSCIKIVFETVDVNTTTSLFGARTAYKTNDFSWMYVSNTQKLRRNYGDQEKTSSGTLPVNTKHTYSQRANWTLNSYDTGITYYNTFTTFYSGTAHIFSVNNNGSPFNIGKLRIYSCEIIGTLERVDFIPVRVGQVGYMYDKISGTLFGNDGTGSFVLGPDVT